MKIQTTTTNGSNADRLNVSGKIITINGTDFDTENLSERIELVEDKLDKAEYDAQRFWIDELGAKCGLLKIGKYHRGPWFDNRMMDFFGFNNGDITLEEFTTYVEWHNEIQAVLDEYSDRIRELKESGDIEPLNAVYAERDAKYKAINKRWLKI